MPSLFHSSRTAALALIAPLYLVAPASVTLLILHYLGVIVLPVAIQTYALIEALFLAYQFWLCRIIQERNRLPVRDHDRTLELFNRALTFGLDVSLEGKPVPHTLTEEHESVASFREAFSAWFFNHPFKALSRDDVINWLAWSLLDLDAHDLDKQQRKLVEDCCDLVERRSAWTFKRAGGIGNDPKAKQGSHVKCIRLTIDPVQMRTRPLVLYLGIAAWNWLWILILKRRGFTHVYNQDRTVEAMLYVPPDWKLSSGARPLLFLHGLGLGFAQYEAFVNKLAHPDKTTSPASSRPLLILLQPSISMNLFHPRHLKPPTRVETVSGIEALLHRYGWDKGGVDIVSHSMGTIIHGWIVKTHAHLVRRSCFVDPVCFVLWEPTVPYNFLYRSPSTGIELLMRYFVAREAGISLMLQRYFDWTDNLLWISEVPNSTDPKQTTFFLAGQDAIISATKVKQYLTERGVSEEEGGLFLDEDAAHGVSSNPERERLITGGPGLNRIVQWVLRPEKGLLEPTLESPALPN